MRSFIIPSKENSITEADIAKGILRITIEFKDYFPSESGSVTISYGNKLSKEVLFRHRTGRSHVLGIGKELVEEIGLRTGDKIKFIELVPRKHFAMERL